MTKFGHDILTSEFPDDDGSAHPGVIEALKAVTTDNSDSMNHLIELLISIRVLVPVVAEIDERDENGADKSSHMSSVLFQSADGRVGLPVFTCVETLNHWNPEARPVPRSLRDVAASAIQEKYNAVLIDMASSHRFALQGINLARVAGVEVQPVYL
ncbi:MAG: hypothetical protein RIS43_379 [Actinomycetota bacterium]|jgi:hypothetical protein